MKSITLNMKQQFHKVFNLNLLDFICPFTGFDIIKFDEYMSHIQSYDIDKDGSLKNFITQRYGNEGTELIKSLINLTE